MELLQTEFVPGDPPVLKVAGEIDLATVDALRTALEQAVSTDPTVVVDMAGVTFFDATGLRVILQAAASRNGAGPLTLRNAPRVAWLLELVGLSELSTLVICEAAESRGGDVIPLGSRLRQRREELGLSQAQAARQLDVARTAYRLWEMEAAKPAPDRWRTIARWLGESMTAMLLAEELIDQEEAVGSGRLAAAAGMTGVQWDGGTAGSAGDYFSQERAMIADQVRIGNISADEAANLSRVLTRIQGAVSDDTASAWHPGQFRKRFPNDSLAPALAHAALAATTIGIPVEAFDSAALLTSELVTNSVRYSGSAWVEVAFTLGIGMLRIEVSDQSRQTVQPRTPDIDGGWGLRLVGELATRWGVDRQRAGKTIWVELDLTAPSM